MAILPIIGRELRVRARSRTLYWSRFAVALVGLQLCVPALSATFSPGARATGMGQFAFASLTVAALVMTLCAGLLTVDGICRQRREGTLGLLFLTSVRPLDVLLGAFGSAGISCLCALIALFPVMILPILTGGVTAAESIRTVLVLIDTIFFSLAIGLWASARAHRWDQTARAWFFMVSSLTGLPYLIPLVGPWFGPPLSDLGFLRCLSPLRVFALAADTEYRTDSYGYWLSLAMINGISWLFLIAAANRLRRSLREENSPAECAAPSVSPKSHRGFPPGADPIRWVVRPGRAVTIAIWLAALLTPIWQIGIRFLLSTSVGSTLAFFYSGISTVIPILQTCVFAWAAGRFFFESSRSGELELLLTTPAGARAILSSQLSVLKRVFFWPVVVLMAPYVMQFFLDAYDVWLGAQSRSFPTEKYMLVLLPCWCAWVVLSTWSTVCLALLFGLRLRSQAAVVVAVTALVRIPPYVLARLVTPLFFGSSVIITSSGMTMNYVIQYFLSPLLASIFFLCLARRSLRRLRKALPDAGQPLFSAAPLAAFLRKARNWPHPENVSRSGIQH